MGFLFKGVGPRGRKIVKAVGVICIVIGIAIAAYGLYMACSASARVAVPPKPPYSLLTEEKDGYIVFYNVTVNEYIEYVKKHGVEPAYRPVLILDGNENIVYADTSFEPVKNYIEARQAHEEYYNQFLWNWNTSNDIMVFGIGVMIIFLSLFIIGLASLGEKQGNQGDG